ncbi:MAG: hypothetical protein LBR77_03045 [Lachnospiraceae bacterium]|jgi:hypothetical protein|nr:hypothetical protein [Lachnospiraceae bacterium]
MGKKNAKPGQGQAGEKPAPSVAAKVGSIILNGVLGLIGLLIMIPILRFIFGFGISIDTMANIVLGWVYIPYWIVVAIVGIGLFASGMNMSGPVAVLFRVLGVFALYLAFMGLLRFAAWGIYNGTFFETQTLEEYDFNFLRFLKSCIEL